MKKVLSWMASVRTCVMLSLNCMAGLAMATPCLIDYIESDGSQYVDTGIVGKSGTKIQLDFMLMEAKSGTDYGVLGCRASTATDSRFFPVHFYGSKVGYGYGTWVSSDPEFYISAGTRYSMTSDFGVGAQILDFEDRRVMMKTWTTVVDTQRNLYLFACNVAGTPSYFAKVRFYGLKIWQDGRLVRNFRPCLDGKEGAIYDEVSHDVFKRAAGAAFQLSALNHIEKGSPDRYVEYIESDGNQVLDTGVPAKTGIKADCDMQWTEILTSGESTFLGAVGSSKSTQRMYMIHQVGGLDQGGHRLWSGYGSTSSNLTDQRWGSSRFIYATASARQRVVADFGTSEPAVCGVYVDGVKGCSVDVGTKVDTGMNLLLFAARNSTGVDYRAKGRCYGLKVWMDGELERDFIPCEKNGKGGLYDKVRGEIVFPVGDSTGSLIGRPINPNAGVMTDVDYVETDGKQYVDTGIVGKSGVKADIELEFTEVGSGDQCILGSRKNVTDKAWFMPLVTYANRLFYGWYEDTDTQWSKRLQANTRYHIVSELKPEKLSVTVNDEVVVDKTDARGALDTEGSMYLFGVNDLKEGCVRFPVKARCYGLKIWQDGVLVRDFKPCRVDGKGGLYDEVTSRVFTSLPYPDSHQANLRVAKVVGMFERKVSGKPDYYVEYLESDGRQILDTGVGDGSGLKAEVDCMVTQGPDAGDENTLLGAYDGHRMLLLHYLPKTDASCRLWTGYGATGDYAKESDGTDMLLQVGVRHSVIVDFSNSERLTLSRDGAIGFDKSSSDTYEDGGTLTLFAANRGGFAQFFAKARCYGLKIWKNGQLARNFRPCVKGGVAGLYDSVEDEVVFPTMAAVENVGEASDPFAGGETFRPKYYLDYVESDGSIYFDTGVMGRSGTKSELEITGMWNDESAGAVIAQDIIVLGARKSIYGLDPQRFYLFGVSQGWAGIGYGGFTYATQGGEKTAVKAGTRMTVVTELNADSQAMDINGQRVHTGTLSGTIDSGLPMYLFANNEGGNASGRGQVRCHRLKIWQNGVLVRDYRPVMTKEGVAALWDEVNEKLCYPSGPFVASGAVIGKFPIGFALFLR